MGLSMKYRETDKGLLVEPLCRDEQAIYKKLHWNIYMDLNRQHQ